MADRAKWWQLRESMLSAHHNEHYKWLNVMGIFQWQYSFSLSIHQSNWIHHLTIQNVFICQICFEVKVLVDNCRYLILICDIFSSYCFIIYIYIYIYTRCNPLQMVFILWLVWDQAPLPLTKNTSNCIFNYCFMDFKILTSFTNWEEFL